MKPIWEIKPNGADVIAINSSTGEVFSGTRDQLNVKLASVHQDSYSRTLVYSDATRQLSSDSASAVTYTIPLESEFDSLQAGSTLTAYQAGTGTVSFTAGPGVTLVGVATSSGRYQSVEVQRIGINTWAVVNKVTAALDANNNVTGLTVPGGEIVGGWGFLYPSGANDSQRLNNYLVACAQAGVSAKLGEGVFLLNDAVIPSNCTIVGSGVGKTILQNAGGLVTGVVNFAAGASNITVSDLTFDGTSAVVARSLVFMGAHGSNIEFRNVQFINGLDRWALRGDPAARFDSLRVIDCEFLNNPKGNFIILPASIACKGSTGVEIIGCISTSCGGNLFGIRDVDTGNVLDRQDFYLDCKFNYNRILSCTPTGSDGPIPVEMWAVTGFQQIGNYMDSGTRGLTAGAGIRNAIISDNILLNQSVYAMEGGRCENVLISNNTATNCAQFYKATTSLVGAAKNLVIENNLIVGTGLTAYNGTTPDDTISLGSAQLQNIDAVVRNNEIRDQEFVRRVISIAAMANSTTTVEGNRYTAGTINSAAAFVHNGDSTGSIFISRNNVYKRTASYTSAHQTEPSTVYRYVGAVAAGTGITSSFQDYAEMSGVISSGTLNCMGAIEAPVARYGASVEGLTVTGAWAAGTLAFADSSGATRLVGVDASGLAAGIAINGSVNAAMLTGLRTGELLIKGGAYVNLGTAVKQGRSVTLHYEGGSGSRVIKVRHDRITGEQTQALVAVSWVCTQNNGAPQSNTTWVNYGNAGSAAAAPFVYSGNGTALTSTTSAVDGSGRMETTLTLPASNNNWLATVTVSLGVTGSVKSFADFSVQVG